MNRAPAERAVKLPWLAPCASSLAALAAGRLDLRWPELKLDPGAVALLYRNHASNQSPIELGPDQLDLVRSILLNPPQGVASWAAPGMSRLLAGARQLAAAAANESDQLAAIVGPLGWYAVAAVDDSAVVECLDNPRVHVDPTHLQRRLWGASAVEIGRRIARRWNLPEWISHAIEADRIPDAAGESLEWHDPFAAPWLPDLLWLAAEVQKARQSDLVERLEAEIDRIHVMLDQNSERQADQIRSAKLKALAEFAAGAGHEFNTPLAVISGQAQYLLQHEPDPARCKALQQIQSQAQRVHRILVDLIQFARPQTPAPQRLSIESAVREVVESIRIPADAKHLSVDVLVDSESAVMADARQAKMALGALIRNAVEAAPAEGWVRISCELRGGLVAICVADSGPGPDASIHENMFDPFFSGREAGRGRGLGLPTAWRLANENGGDVAYEPHDGVTRFVLTLPAAESGLGLKIA